MVNPADPAAYSWGHSPTLDEFAAAIAAAKRGEVLPESDAWLEANARTRPDWRDDSAAEAELAPTDEGACCPSPSYAAATYCGCSGTARKAQP